MLVCDRCKAKLKKEISDLQRALKNEEIGEYCDQCCKKIEDYLAGTHVIIMKGKWKELMGRAKK